MFALRIVIAVFCLVWVLQAIVYVRNRRAMRTLAKLDSPEPREWPRVSVIAPARDEAVPVGPALLSRLADDYPDLEVVAVDDRSTDGTGDIIRELAARDARVVPLRIDRLPEGWLGKVHAMNAGAQVATGEWLLFSDADVRVEPGAMRRVIAYALAQRFDHVALVPRYETRSVWVDAVWTVFLRVIGIVVSPDAVRDTSRPKVAIGSGAFNLVRREAFVATEGFEWLRLDTTDDISLAVMMKRHGFRSDVLDGHGSASVLIYRDLADFYHGTEKNAGALLGTPLWVFVLGTLVWLALEWSSLIAVAIGPDRLRILGGATFVLATAVNVDALRRNTGRTGPAFLWPVGSGIFASTTIRALWLAHRRGGIVWRDTFYPSGDILAARRFRLGMRPRRADEGS
jgi:glycosyltransferase involved in cell wall biosynthesis